MSCWHIIFRKGWSLYTETHSGRDPHTLTLYYLLFYLFYLRKSDQSTFVFKCIPSAKWKKKTRPLRRKTCFRFIHWTQWRLNWCSPKQNDKRTSPNRHNFQIPNHQLTRQTNNWQAFLQNQISSSCGFCKVCSCFLGSEQNNHPRQSSPHPNFNNFHPNKKKQKLQIMGVMFTIFTMFFCFTCCFFHQGKSRIPVDCLTATAAPRIKALEKPELGNDTLN